MKNLILPNFFIVGAPKAGTTSLYYYLKNHPEVFMSPIKEPDFFSYKEIEAQNLYYKRKRVKDFKEYVGLFRGVKNEKAIGEASVSYLFYPEVPLKIKELIPDARIVIILRNPFERAYSHYLMDYKLGYINIPFEHVVFKKTNAKLADLYYQQYVELGFYYAQVKRYLDVFGKNKVLILFNEDLKNNPEQVMLTLFGFLKVKQDVNPDMFKFYNAFGIPKNRVIKKLYSLDFLRNSIRKVVPRAYLEKMKKIFFDRKKPELREGVKEYLKRIYKGDIEKLELLINKDLSMWYR